VVRGDLGAISGPGIRTWHFQLHRLLRWIADRVLTAKIGVLLCRNTEAQSSANGRGLGRDYLAIAEVRTKWHELCRNSTTSIAIEQIVVKAASPSDGLSLQTGLRLPRKSRRSPVLPRSWHRFPQLYQLDRPRCVHLLVLDLE
jgi:ectoine hydroxylase-related dioxygenase (phytanoyl-CoA dioxygenase family)